MPFHQFPQRTLRFLAGRVTERRYHALQALHVGHCAEDHIHALDHRRRTVGEWQQLKPRFDFPQAIAEHPGLLQRLRKPFSENYAANEVVVVTEGRRGWPEYD